MLGGQQADLEEAERHTNDVGTDKADGLNTVDTSGTSIESPIFTDP
jgi:hypothetical protein